MKINVTKAIERFRSGERPWELRSASWFVVGDGGELFPAKYIWALAIGSKPSSFHTSEARRELNEREYSVIQKNNLYSANKASWQAAPVQESIEEVRRKALQAKGRPQERLALATFFDRDRYVVAETLRRAGGYCEECQSEAPFLRKSDNTPYLEVHHRVPLSDGGDDSLQNTVAVCPNCHRRAHFG